MRGFTLIELLVIIGIVSILTTMVLVNYQDFVTRSTIRTRVTDIADFIRHSQFLSSATFVKGVNVCGAGTVATSGCDKIDLSSETISGFEFVRIAVKNNILHAYSIERTKAITDFSAGIGKCTARDLICPEYSIVSKERERGGGLASENYTVDIFINGEETKCDNVENYEIFIYFKRPDTRPQFLVDNMGSAICTSSDLITEFKMKFSISSGDKARSVVVKSKGLITID